MTPLVACVSPRFQHNNCITQPRTERALSLAIGSRRLMRNAKMHCRAQASDLVCRSRPRRLLFCQLIGREPLFVLPISRRNFHRAAPMRRADAVPRRREPRARLANEQRRGRHLELAACKRATLPSVSSTICVLAQSARLQRRRDLFSIFVDSDRRRPTSSIAIREHGSQISV